MTTETMQCKCGRRVQQRVDFITPAYVVTFEDAETRQLTVACVGCGTTLYSALRDGSLKAANNAAAGN